jgi:hypothetical protein
MKDGEPSDLDDLTIRLTDNENRPMMAIIRE